MTRKILTKGGLEWISCRANSTSALARDLVLPRTEIESKIYADVVQAAILMTRARQMLEKALQVPDEL